MSQLVYNGITLPYFHCTNFKQIAIRDDLGDTDWILTRFQISGNCVINADYTELLAPDLIENNGEIGSDSAAFLMKVIRTRLMTHKKRLSYTFNGVELMPTVQSGNIGTVDAENGPKPQSCDILHLYNNMFYISFSITASYWENGSSTRNINSDDEPPNTDNPRGNPVLFNRWSESVEINELNFTSRVRNGKFKIRSDNDSGFIADQLRTKMCVVGVPKGFLRYSSRYTVTPDGLAIQYQIEDREVFKYPPTPAYKAEGHYYETGGKGDATRFIECAVKLQGSPDTDQTQLLVRCMQVVGSKLQLARANQVNPDEPVGGEGAKFDSANIVIIGASVKIGMYDNWVEVWLKAQITHTEGRFQSIAFLSKTVCFTPFSDKGGEEKFPGARQPVYNVRGSKVASKLLQAAAYYDPSIRATVVNAQTEQLDRGIQPGQGGTIGVSDP